MPCRGAGDIESVDRGWAKYQVSDLQGPHLTLYWYRTETPANASPKRRAICYLPFRKVITTSGPAHLHEKLLCILQSTLTWAIWALESRPFAQSDQRFMCNDVPTWHHHRRIFVSGLLLRDGADEDGMEVICWRQWNFNLYNYLINLLFILQDPSILWHLQEAHVVSSIPCVSLS